MTTHPRKETPLSLVQVEIDVVGITEIAARAGTSTSVVRVWRARHRTFPAPIADLAMGPVFDWRQVERWLAVPRPNGRPRKAA